MHRSGHLCFVANPCQSSTNFSMTAPGAMNNHIQANSVCPARESNPRPSTFRADALTTELRGWDNSTRRNLSLTFNDLPIRWLYVIITIITDILKKVLVSDRFLYKILLWNFYLRYMFRTPELLKYYHSIIEVGESICFHQIFYFVGFA